MADYIVTSGELTTVANAIRAKNGTSSNLSWPDGFVSGISSGSGGGGSSDFSTATVTLTNPPQGGGTVEFEQSVYISDVGSMFGGGGGFTNIQSSIPFVLYKGTGYANFPLKQNFAVTGDIEYDQEYGDLIIRGDGTITIS